MSRFFVTPEAVGETRIRLTNPDDLHHMLHVLRLRPGEEIDISDGVAWEYRCALRMLRPELAEAEILDRQAFAREPVLDVTLYQGIPRQGKMETIIQKGVELGVSRIVPVFTARSVAADSGRTEKKLLRWQRVADESVKQCRRGKIPEIGPMLAFADMAKQLDGFDCVLFPYEQEEKRTIKRVLRYLPSRPRSLCLIIGPEGGFSRREAETLEEAGALCVSLGKTILRTETAGPAALAMVMYELEME